MSCRVLKRDMEYAMMDKLTETCRAQDILYIYGYYIPTAKNGMVKNFISCRALKRSMIKRKYCLAFHDIKGL